jgi:DNA-binding NarL/FixJ family response regulator
MTAEELRKAEARYQRASARAEALRLERNATILEALAAGWTHATIAKTTGLTRGRIGQLAK